jgi:hypothetical protein
MEERGERREESGAHEKKKRVKSHYGCSFMLANMKSYISGRERKQLPIKDFCKIKICRGQMVYCFGRLTNVINSIIFRTSDIIIIMVIPVARKRICTGGSEVLTS